MLSKLSYPNHNAALLSVTTAPSPTAKQLSWQHHKHHVHHSFMFLHSFSYCKKKKRSFNRWRSVCETRCNVTTEISATTQMSQLLGLKLQAAGWGTSWAVTVEGKPRGRGSLTMCGNEAITKQPEIFWLFILQRPAECIKHIPAKDGACCKFIVYKGHHPHQRSRFLCLCSHSGVK